MPFHLFRLVGHTFCAGPRGAWQAGQALFEAGERSLLGNGPGLVYGQRQRFGEFPNKFYPGKHGGGRGDGWMGQNGPTAGTPPAVWSAFGGKYYSSY